ncbi:MAG: hypothetical protein Ta2D_03920 [Rickettsiales bacterium]|nr:MAG: hypothetical protein Ta2D_03920 [Rickettsiales bacterium]
MVNTLENKRKTLTLSNKDFLKNKSKKTYRDGVGDLSDNKDVNDFLKKNNKVNTNPIGERKIINLDTKPVASTPKIEAVAEKTETETQKKLSIHEILVLENQKKLEQERQRVQEEIARKEQNRKIKQDEQLKRFNAKTRGDYNKDNDKNNGEKRDFKGGFHNGEKRDFKGGFHNGEKRSFGDKGGFKSGEKRDFKGGFHNGEKRSFGDKGGGFKSGEKRDFGNRGSFGRPNFLTPPQPIVDDNKPKKDFKDKKDYNKNYEDDEKKRNKKIVYIADDDEDGVMARRKKKSYFKDKSRNNQNQEKIIHDIELPEFITVSDLSDKMGEKRADVVKKLIMMGMPVTINQTIDADTAELVVAEFGHSVKKRTTEHDIENKLDENEGSVFVKRAPVVTIMGHVDHGKTSLLDAIRTTKIAEGESGGITQHIGASRIQVENGKYITFIDTPGHEAFTEMRMRGANITDIVVLVVAADDGVKDQTIEAINHTKAAKAPIILAINKIDKPGANPKKVKEELLQYDVVCEEFGGDVMAVEVSAKDKIGLDKLKETILLQAEMMNLEAPTDVKATGVVIESKMEQNKGAVATLLVQKGILKTGDLILAGTTMGRIKKMINSQNKIQKDAEPSMAVEILGLSDVPSAGDQFNVVENDKEAREIIAYRERKTLENKVAKRSVKSLDSMLKVVGGKSAKLLPIIIKADVNGSIEAIIGTLTKLNTDEVEIDVIHSATGAINATDINLANISNALIIAFNVRATNSISDLAKEKDIDIRYYSIIYNIVDDIKNILSGMLEPTIREEITGHAEVRQVFKITNVGTVAGSFVIDGELSRSNKVRLVRDGIVIYTGEISALKRFKDDVKEVKTGFECGISIENYNDLKEKDIIEGFKFVEEKREL